MRFFKIITPEGRAVWINPMKVESVTEKDSGKTYIHLGHESYWLAKGNARGVLCAIYNATLQEMSEK